MREQVLLLPGGFPKESPLALAPWGMLSPQCPRRRAAKIPMQSGKASREPPLNLCAFRSWHFSGDAELAGGWGGPGAAGGLGTAAG